MKNKDMSFIVAFIIVIIFAGFISFMIINNKTSQVDNQQKLGEPLDNNINNVDINKININEADASKENMEKVSKNGDVLVMNYTGRFVDGKVFDSNVDPKFNHVEPFEFTLGAGMVIKGWDEGLLGMKIGEKKTLTISPDKAYGPNDYHGIPGNSTLIFDVELLGIK